MSGVHVKVTVAGDFADCRVELRARANDPASALGAGKAVRPDGAVLDRWATAAGAEPLLAAPLPYRLSSLASIPEGAHAHVDAREGEERIQ